MAKSSSISSGFENQISNFIKKTAKEIAMSEEETLKLLNAQPEEMDLYKLEDIGYFINGLCPNNDGASIRDQVLALPPIVENKLESQFQDFDKCRGFYFLLIYIQSLIKRNDDNKLSKLFIANVSKNSSALLTKVAQEGEIYFFNFIKEEHRTDIKMPNLSELEKLTNLNISPNNFGL